MGRWWGWAAGASLQMVVAGCGGGDDAPERETEPLESGADPVSGALAETRPDGTLEAPEPFLRVDLARRADGALELLSASRVLLRCALMPSFVAEHVLVSRSARRHHPRRRGSHEFWPFGVFSGSL